MKRCDNLAIASSSLSDPEDSFWRDFNFDFSFLTSDDQKSDDTVPLSNPSPRPDSSTIPKESELYGLAGVDSNITMVEEERSPPSSSAVLTTPVAMANSRNERAFSPLFAKMSALRVKETLPIDLDDTEVDSPCWKETPSKSLSFRRSRDDLSVIYGLNPMAPQFIPSNAKMNLDKYGNDFGENGSPSLKRSLSSTFPPSSGEIEQGSNQTNIIHDADESLGILDISNQFQRRIKLDPLAPVFVPAYAVVHDKSGVPERNASSEFGHIGGNPYTNNVHESGKTYLSDPRLGSQVLISKKTKLDSFSNRTHCSKKKLNPLAPQFSLADTKPKVYGSVEKQAPNDLPTNFDSSVLFPPVGYRNHNELHAGLTQPSVHVEPSFKEVDIKQMGRPRPNILHGNSSSQMDVKKLLTTIHGLSELLTHVHGSETSRSPNEQDLELINSTVKNLNSYINKGMQEHTGKYDGLTSLPNMCKQPIRELQIPKAINLSANVGFKRKEKHSMVLGETRAEAPFENGYGQVVRNHETEEQINPQVLFYKSLWLKARADRSLMEYETFLSSSRT